MNRSSGILLPISSLPSPYGIGTFGAAAYAFADFLHEAGQKYWQLLPLGPTSYGDSPYQSFSTFAGNPYFVDLDLLIEDGLLLAEEVEVCDWEKIPVMWIMERFTKAALPYWQRQRQEAMRETMRMCRLFVRKMSSGWIIMHFTWHVKSILA